MEARFIKLMAKDHVDAHGEWGVHVYCQGSVMPAPQEKILVTRRGKDGQPRAKAVRLGVFINGPHDDGSAIFAIAKKGE